MEFPPPHQPTPAPPPTTYVVAREDVWGRPIFRAPALTVFTSPELLRPRAPVFPARRFRSAARKRSNAA